MTDRVKGLTVVFEEDMRDDDAEAIINGIRMMRNVASVTPRLVNSDDYYNREKIRVDLQTKIWEALKK